jgi:hypothetical protein
MDFRLSSDQRRVSQRIKEAQCPAKDAQHDFPEWTIITPALPPSTPMLMNFLIILGLFSIVASAATIYAIFTAKIGYEDESGFHWGIPRSADVRPNHPNLRQQTTVPSLPARFTEPPAATPSVEQLAHV